ncbi:MAG: hypothetical protein C5S48_09110 [Candidatus Methanogaster sp.]|nr:MAG: hypothetical protein C5S48_09110 [ANME-2 cluster archaeon]
MLEEERISEILNTIQNIKESKLPVTTYFEQNSVPFTRKQYYRYCRILKKSSEDGLYDKRVHTVAAADLADLTRALADLLAGWCS